RTKCCRLTSGSGWQRDSSGVIVSVLMQTLNVGAGRTDEEYKAAEEQHRADLRADSRSNGNYFFVAAALAALGTGLLPLRLNIIVSIGSIDLLTAYAHQWVQFDRLLALAAAVHVGGQLSSTWICRTRRLSLGIPGGCGSVCS